MNIRVISLINALDRRKFITKQLDGVDFTFFDAVDGRKRGSPPPPIISKHHDPLLRSWLRGKPESKGALGLFASHYLLWKECVQTNKLILVLEDDCMINNRLLKELIHSGTLELITCHYGYIRLQDADPNPQVFVDLGVIDGVSVRKLFKNEHGTSGYTLAPTSAHKLIENSKGWVEAVDNYIGMFWRHKVEAFTINPSIAQASHGLFPSSIQIASEDGIIMPFYKRITREIYTGWRKLRRFIHNTQFKMFTCKKWRTGGIR